MCGITGYWKFDGSIQSDVQLERFTDTLAHRGPDSRGSVLLRDSGLYLGHRRLSILDLSAHGHQPMRSADGRYVITFNGEVYNFVEVRDELAAQGHTFVGDSDTEVLLQAFIRWGMQCVQRLNGMWAFAVWDNTWKRLYLCRDRFGVKPLHYYMGRGFFAFASELKAFLALPDWHFAFDEGVIARALCSANYVEATRETVLAGVRRVPPGCWLEMRKGMPQPVIRRWWRTVDHMQDPRELAADPRQIQERFLSLFENACQLRMRSDVPIGTALSGGLDSSSVYAMMYTLARRSKHTSRMATNWQNAFVACYPGTSQDEERYARMVVDHFKGEASFQTMRPADGIETLRDYVYSVEEIYPYRGSLWLLYRKMRERGVYISIDGHGGDEILAGYHHYPLVAMLDVARQHRGLAPVRNLKQLHRSLFVDPAMASVRGLRNLLHGFRPDSVFHFATAHLKVTPAPAYFPEFAEDAMALQTASQLTRNLYFDFHFALLPTILRNFDRVSMAHGVEIRAPFLDYALVSFCMSLPNQYKISDQFTKQLMRSSMRPLLPPAVCDRKDKVGFLEPFTPWLREGFGQIMLDVSASQAFLQSDIWDGKAVNARIERAWKEEQWGALSYYWPFVQAQMLFDIFAEKRRAHLLPN